MTTRNQDIVDRFKQGQTYQQIGDAYGVSRERIRQIVKTAGLTGKDGGKRTAMVRQEALRDASRAEQAEFRSIHQTGGSRQERSALEARLSPLAATRFRSQRQSAKKRGIEWRLSYIEWMRIWVDSGHWQDRGRGHGKFVMSRKNDTGPYAKENIFIQLADQNNSQRGAVLQTYPIGVSRVYNRYLAMKMLHGRQRYLGSFATPEEAHEAYIRAV